MAHDHGDAPGVSDRIGPAGLEASTGPGPSVGVRAWRPGGKRKTPRTLLEPSPSKPSGMVAGVIGLTKDRFSSGFSRAVSPVAEPNQAAKLTLARFPTFGLYMTYIV